MDILAFFRNQLMRAVLFLYGKCLKPRAQDEDLRRKEGILNILLFASIVFSSLLLSIVVYNQILLGSSRRGVPLGMMALIVGSFVFLLILSRRGWRRLSAFLLIILYAVPTTYGLYIWGADFPQGILMCVLIIAMSSILLGTSFSLWVMGIISCVLLVVTYGQLYGFITPLSYWKQRPGTMQDGVAVVTALGVMTVISWLSNREIDKSLNRARISERALKAERDSLEMIVEARTNEVKRLQIEKMTQMYQFVEFGRLSAGFFHDLASPLTSLSLNLERLKAMAVGGAMEAGSCVERALGTAKKLEGFLDMSQRQLRQQEVAMSFSLTEEITCVLQVLEYKARSADVTLVFIVPETTEFLAFGNPFKFNKIIMNLVSNAIDAYDGVSIERAKRCVVIELSRQDSLICCSICDHGSGINPQHVSRIFDPFFTTKPLGKGMGIGLSTSKDMVEKEFQGSIEVKSQMGKGSTFSVKFLSEKAVV